ncbi:hypothetical protein HPS57_04195 [Prevotella sp. PINT]|jgi:hypothetical protein|uniref:hypothetical protein n=1 Tax=Palleniella intestinalis TaxID=2736291 RepID=UPI001556F50C|nr:hypothetical protein [Palleniella intestinalis]NPD81174.1 hypothetical protein [Palleniella intestinalis]
MRIDPADKLIFVNIKQSYEAMLSKDTTHPLYRETIKECTRKYWPISDDKADAATHILGCYNGFVKEVIEISSYTIDKDNYPGRKVFEGREIKDSKYMGLDIRELFDNLANFRVRYYNFE